MVFQLNTETLPSSLTAKKAPLENFPNGVAVYHIPSVFLVLEPINEPI